MLDSIDFTKPFLKEFSKAKLEVLKKSFDISSEQRKSVKFPSNFVPFNKLNTINPIKPKIDFKPLFTAELNHNKVKEVNLITFDQNEKLKKKQLKIKELVNIVKKHVEPNKKKQEQVNEKNQLDAMFDDIFAKD